MQFSNLKNFDLLLNGKVLAWQKNIHKRNFVANFIFCNF